MTRQQKFELSATQNPCAGSTSDEKSELRAHQIPGASSPPHWFSTLSVHQMPVPADLRTGFPTFSPLHGNRSFSLSFPNTDGPARPLLSITMHATGASACPNVSINTSTYGHGCLLPRPLDTASSASTVRDSRTGCVGLAANGAGPRRCTAGVTPASVRTRDRRTEVRTDCPSPLCPRSGRPHPSFPGVT